MNTRTARRAERAEWEQRSSVSRAGRAACGPFFATPPCDSTRRTGERKWRVAFFETRPSALRFLSGRAAPSPFFAPSRAALMCGNQVQQLGRIPEGAFLFGRTVTPSHGQTVRPCDRSTVRPELAGAPPARSRRPGKAKRLARRRDAGAQVAAHTRSAARPTGRRIVAGETSRGGRRILATPRRSPGERLSPLGLGAVRGWGFRRGATRRTDGTPERRRSFSMLNAEC